jgi:hypothetical protein
MTHCHREDNAMNSRIHFSTALLLTLGSLVSPLALADVVSVETNTGSVQVPVGERDAEFIAKTISVQAPRTLVISYHAECQVERGHVEYDIVVNRSILAVTARQTPPTNDTLSALCSNDGDTPESNLRAVSAGTTVACTVTAPDSYTVKVRGHVESPSFAGAGVVDDQSLVIVEHPYSTGLPPCTFELPGVGN